MLYLEDWSKDLKRPNPGNPKAKLCQSVQAFHAYGSAAKISEPSAPRQM